MKQILLAMTLGMGLSATSLTAQVTLEDVAPANTVFLGSIRNVDAMMTRLERTRLHDLLNHEDVKALTRDAVEEMSDGMNEMLRELGLDPERISRPTGNVGLAVFTVSDPELGMPVPAFLALADFGESAEDIAELVKAALERGEREQGLMYEVRDVSGRDVYIVDFSSLEGEPDEPDDDPMHMHHVGPPDISDRFEMMHLVRDGGLLMLSNDMNALTDAIDRIDGRLPAGLRDRSDYRAVLDQIGENDAYAMLLTRDALSLGAMADPSGMMLMMAVPVLKSVFGEIRGFGMGVHVDGPKAMVEMRSSVYMPLGKAGLMRLLDVESQREDLPAFVGPNATSYSRMNFAFDQFTAVVRQIIRSNPMLAMQVGQEYDQFEPTIEQFMSLLGPRVHIVNTVTRPITEESVQTLFVVDCKDVQQFENLIGEHAPMMGLEPRDFLGSRIYTLDGFGMMGPGPSISLGVGGGHLMFGPTSAVEQSLRAISRPDDAPSLREVPQFQRAVGALEDRAVVNWGYTDMVESLEAQFAVLRQTLRTEMQGADLGVRPEHAEELRQAMKWIDKLNAINFDMIRRHVGPSVSQTYSTDDGFIMETYLLEGADD